MKKLIIVFFSFVFVGCDTTNATSSKAEYNSESAYTFFFQTAYSKVGHEAARFYEPVKDSLESDGSTIYRLINSCEHNSCYLGVGSSDSAYLLKAFEKACTEYNFIKNPTKNRTTVYYFGPDRLRERAIEVAHNCAKHFVFVSNQETQK